VTVNYFGRVYRKRTLVDAIAAANNRGVRKGFTGMHTKEDGPMVTNPLCCQVSHTQLLITLLRRTANGSRQSSKILALPQGELLES